MIDVKETLGKAEEKMQEAVMYLEEAMALILLVTRGIIKANDSRPVGV